MTMSTFVADRMRPQHVNLPATGDLVVEILAAYSGGTGIPPKLIA
jgi:hypothetical protein